MLISICGDICSECPRYKATINNDKKELQGVAKTWFELGFRDRIVNIEEIKCHGCNKQKPCSYGLNDCTYLEGKDNCGECDTFRCEKLKAVFEKSALVDKQIKCKCKGEDFLYFKRIFFSKEEILSEINCKKQQCNQ